MYLGGGLNRGPCVITCDQKYSAVRLSSFSCSSGTLKQNTDEIWICKYTKTSFSCFSSILIKEPAMQNNLFYRVTAAEFSGYYLTLVFMVY